MKFRFVVAFVFKCREELMKRGRDDSSSVKENGEEMNMKKSEAKAVGTYIRTSKLHVNSNMVKSLI